VAGTATDAIPTHVTNVLRTTPLSPSFTRVTFGGGLDRFRPVGPDQFVYVLLPPLGSRDLTVDTSFGWSGYLNMPEAERPVGAYYTVRHHRPDLDEVDCDFFLHDPAGAASAWAAEAAPGYPAALWGPRTAWDPPPSTRRFLLVADETGIPATAAVLESLPAGAEVTVVVEVSDPADAELLPCEVICLVRGAGDEVGTTEHLAEAVRTVDLRSDGLYAWGGGESRAMRDVRTHLRRVVGVDRTQVSLTPYWRHATLGVDLPDE